MHFLFNNKNLNNVLKMYNVQIINNNNNYIFIVNSKQIINIFRFLKDHQNSLFKILIEITIVDYPNQKKRFHVIYCLLSVKLNIRIQILTFLNDKISISSITNLFKSACWLEREAFDMFGVYFEKHPDLRRILTDYGFFGFPLRKDFPLSGYLEVRYDDSQKRVIYENLEMNQEYRLFNFKSFWE
jgi:NADH-quinone oxidoreductase subunit C